MPKKRQYTLSLKKGVARVRQYKAAGIQCVSYRRQGRQCRREQCKGRAVQKISLGPSASAAK